MKNENGNITKSTQNESKMYVRLRAKIVENYTSCSSFANALGMTKYALSRRLVGKAEFTADEMALTCDLLGIRYSDAPVYFFDDETEVCR